MTSELKLHFLLAALFFIGLNTLTMSSATLFTLQNSCTYTVWPATISGDGAAPLGGGAFELPPGDTLQLPAPQGWSGRFWARTGCSAGASRCATGDGGAPPLTLAEFTIGSGDGGNDFYDVSLVDGYNVGLSVRPYGGAGAGECRSAGCVADVNGICPEELRVVAGDSGGEVVACRSACAAFGTAEFCCTGEHGEPDTCRPTPYSEVFKSACPTAYSYAYDDETSTCTCSGADYVITFCPSA